MPTAVPNSPKHRSHPQAPAGVLAFAGVLAPVSAATPAGARLPGSDPAAGR
ncbi:hypothetical protein [Nocardia bhagyanarayanae]|uniref:hypothetical protein n=1 Tax=Nocardia bhagyanarayanae TaxID=1215925 RepID=UPI00163A6306|nr:hypothetical protein [Nocardia bhagyanarayanae]